MADNLQDRGAKDRVDVEDEHQVSHWTNRFACTEQELKRAVRKAGHSALAVESMLRRTRKQKAHIPDRIDLNQIGAELVLVELEVANVWLEITAERSTQPLTGTIAKARAALFTVDLITGQLALRESVRRAMTDARDHLWARLRLLEARVNRSIRAAA